MDMAESKGTLQIWHIAKINLRHNSSMHFALAIVILIFTPILFGITNLDAAASAVPLEMLVALIGIVLLTPIFQPEQNGTIEDVIGTKCVSSIYVYIIRTIYSLIGITLLTAAFIVIMGLCGSAVTPVLLSGTIAEAMFLGSLGMVTAAVTNNTAVSYMIPIAYYALNISGGSKLGNFYLFSMMKEEYMPKIWLFGAGIVLTILALLTKWMVGKNR